MEITEIHRKLDNLFDIQEKRELKAKEEKELVKLKKLRNKSDPN